MITRGAFRGSSGLLVVACLFLAVPAFAQNYNPLEILNIKPVGAPPTGMSQYSRIYRAYPGLTYNIRAAVIGGNYPYTFTLSNAPSGMSVDANTGEINWTNPQANATPTLTIRDQSGAQVITTWPITVGTSGFRFIDAVSGSDTNAGTQASPWRTVGRAKTAGGARDIWYFRSGTYLVQSTFGPLINPDGSRWQAAFTESQSVIWLGYPGESPVLDYGYATKDATVGQYRAPAVGLSGSTVYIDGFETRNTQHFFFITGGEGQGPTFRRLKMHNQGWGWIESGSNTSYLMYEHASPQSYGAVIQDCEFYDGGLGVKHYDLIKPLIADNVFHDILGGVEEKAGTTKFTIRGNKFLNIGYLAGYHLAIGGNYNANTYEVSGEVCFNLVRMAEMTDDAYYFRRDSPSPGIHAYRNTFVGTVVALNISSADGIFNVKNNVIINNDNVANHVIYSSVTDGTKIVFSNNLSGFPSDNIIDANGNLTAAYAQYVGVRGHQLGTGTQTLTAPTNLRITPQ
jgi:Putative Ig domain